MGKCGLSNSQLTIFDEGKTENKKLLINDVGWWSQELRDMVLRKLVNICALVIILGSTGRIILIIGRCLRLRKPREIFYHASA